MLQGMVLTTKIVPCTSRPSKHRQRGRPARTVHTHQCQITFPRQLLPLSTPSKSKPALKINLICCKPKCQALRWQLKAPLSDNRVTPANNSLRTRGARADLEQTFCVTKEEPVPGNSPRWLVPAPPAHPASPVISCTNTTGDLSFKLGGNNSPGFC